MITSVISILIFVFYWKTIFYKYTGSDYFPTIYGSSDLGKVFLEPLFGTEGISETASFYRPFHSFIVYLNYNFGGLDNHIIYQITNIVIFVIASIVIYYFIKRIMNRKMAFFVTGFFIIHPSLMSAIPFVPRRGDVLVIIFILTTLLAIDNYIKNNSKKWIMFALILSFFAYLSKESAIILPGLIFLFILYRREKEISINEIKKVLIEIVPYILVWLLFMILRYLIIRSIGGYQASGINFLLQTSIVFGVLVFGYFNLYPLNRINLGDAGIVSHHTTQISHLEIILAMIIFLIFMIYPILRLKYFFKSKTKKIYLEDFCLLWIFCFGLIYLINGNALPWYVILILVPANIIVFKLFTNDNNKIKKILLAIFVIINLIFIPLFMPYESFDQGSQIKEELVPIYIENFRNLPDDNKVYSINNFQGFKSEMITHTRSGIQCYGIYSLVKLNYPNLDVDIIKVIGFNIIDETKNFSIDYETQKRGNSVIINMLGENVEFETVTDLPENIIIDIGDNNGVQTVWISFEDFDEKDYVSILSGGYDNLAVDMISLVEIS